MLVRADYPFSGQISTYIEDKPQILKINQLTSVKKKIAAKSERIGFRF